MRERERERGGFNNFLSLKSLIEDLWYASFFKSTISLIVG